MKREAPSLQGAPTFPGQQSYVRYVMENGICVGVWVYDNDGNAVELPVSHINHDIPVNSRGEYAFTVPAEYVSEASDGV